MRWEKQVHRSNLNQLPRDKWPGNRRRPATRAANQAPVNVGLSEQLARFDGLTLPP